MTTPGNTSAPSNGSSSSSPVSAGDQLFANFVLFNEMRNANQPRSSMPALLQSIETFVLQRLDALLSMEASAMGLSKDTLMLELFFANQSASNGF
jgi:hypothetical protein